jgi:hypothetical protein
MGNVILGMCGGYTASHIEAFLLTCRRHYSGRLVMFVSDCGDDVDARLRDFDVEIVHAKSTKTPALDRFFLCLDYIKRDESIERVLMSDVKDVVFQADPFASPADATELKFYAEAAPIAESSSNCNWLERDYGAEALARLLDKPILNVGTVLASRQGAIEFLTRLTTEVRRLATQAWGADQSALNFLAYSGKFPTAEIVQHGYGEVQTMAQQKVFTIDAKGMLLNLDGTYPAVLHQYDRHEFLVRSFDVRHFQMSERELKRLKKIDKSRSAAFKHLLSISVSKTMR